MSKNVAKTCGLFHGGFYPFVKLPMGGPRPPLGGALSANEACLAHRKEDKKKAPAANGSKQRKEKHTLVLDIDETLLHANSYMDEGREVASLGRDQPKGFEDVAKLLDLGNKAADIRGAVYFDVWPRPYLREFLEEVTDLFEVIFWTAGTSAYMAAIINMLERQFLDKKLAGTQRGQEDAADVTINTSFLYDFSKNVHLLAQDGMTDEKIAAACKAAAPMMNFYGYSRNQTLGSNRLKHIPLLGKNPDNVILMDDATRSFVYTPRSAILVDQFRYPSDQQDDTFLRDVMPMLRAVAKSDCATRELDHWRADDYAAFDNMDENSDKFLYAYPSGESKKKTTQLGHFQPKRRENGPISLSKPFGTTFETATKAKLDAEVAQIQAQHTQTQFWWKTGFKL